MVARSSRPRRRTLWTRGRSRPRQARLSAGSWGRTRPHRRVARGQPRLRRPGCGKTSDQSWASLLLGSRVFAGPPIWYLASRCGRQVASLDPSPRMWGCLSLARRCDCRQPWSAARRREMDRCTAWCRLPAHRRLLIHLMNQHRHRRSSVCRNMCVTADPQALGSFGDGDVGVASAQLQQRLSVDTNGLCATLREVLGDDRYESLTAIPRLQPTRLQLPNRKRRPLPGASGDRRASAKRRQSQSDSPRRLRPTVRARRHSVGA